MSSRELRGQGGDRPPGELRRCLDMGRVDSQNTKFKPIAFCVHPAAADGERTTRAVAPLAGLRAVPLPTDTRCQRPSLLRQLPAQIWGTNKKLCALRQKPTSKAQ